MVKTENCLKYKAALKLVPYKRFKDGYAWRYMKRACTSYKKYNNIKMDLTINNLELLTNCWRFTQTLFDDPLV